MPLARRTAYHPAFPPAVRPRGVGCIRVAHPSATLTAPEGADPVRLACIRPAASVHPEPGSNSSLYYCSSKLTSVSWAPLSFLPSQVPYPPSPHLPRRRVDVLCWPQAFKDLFRIRSLLSCPSSFVCGLQKYNLLHYLQWVFSLFLQNNCYCVGLQGEKFLSLGKNLWQRTPINIKGRRNGGGSGAT